MAIVFEINHFNPIIICTKLLEHPDAHVEDCGAVWQGDQLV